MGAEAEGACAAPTDLHQAPLLLPSALRQMAGTDWQKALAVLQQQFDLLVVESGDLFSVSYKQVSHCWQGTQEQRLVYGQSRGTAYQKPSQEPDQDMYNCVCLPFIKFWAVGEQFAAELDPWDADDGVQVLKLDDHLMIFSSIAVNGISQATTR